MISVSKFKDKILAETFIIYSVQRNGLHDFLDTSDN